MGGEYSQCSACKETSREAEMIIIFIVISSMLIFGQMPNNPQPVDFNGKVLFDENGLIREVEDCLVEVNGFEQPVIFMTDSGGTFTVALDIPRDYYLFDINLSFQFSKQLALKQFITAERSVSPKLIANGKYDLGHIYLVDADTIQAKRLPTVWDMLEDSLALLHSMNRGLTDDMTKLNVRMSSTALQNEQYQKHIGDLELQSDNYYDQIQELRMRYNQMEMDFASTQSKLTKQQLSRTLFDNIFIEQYLDLITIRDSILVLLDSSLSTSDDFSARYNNYRQTANKYLHRQDLFAENSGIRETNYNLYLDVGGLRDSILIKQDRIVKMYGESEETDAYYYTLADNRTLCLTIQDSLIISNLIYFDHYELHEVVPGDHLWNIAKQHRLYANPYAWRILFLYNKDQIADPDSIYPGQVLKVPVPEE